MVPYATPGVELAKAYFKVIRNNDRGSSGLIFLQNHGLIVSGDSAEWVIGETERVTGIIENELQTARMKPYHNMMKLWPYFPEKILWKVTDENVLRAYRAREEWDHAFCPDCIVFIGKRILKLDAKFGKDDIDRFIEKYDIPAVIDYGKSLYICADSVRTALEIQSVLSFSAQVMEMNQGVECRFLTEREQNYLMNWDAEKFRKNLKQK